MTSEDKATNWHKRWRARIFEAGYVETKAFLTQDIHAKVVEIAKQTGQRIPMLLAQMVDSFLSQQNGSTEIKTAIITSEIASISATQADMDTLSDIIFRSRFPGDTGSSRMRQVGLVNLIDAQLLTGQRPIARTMAQLIGCHPTQIEALSKLMESRGVIRRIRLPGVTHPKAGKVLTITDDAVAALDDAHQRETGISLL